MTDDYGEGWVRHHVSQFMLFATLVTAISLMCWVIVRVF